MTSWKIVKFLGPRRLNHFCEPAVTSTIQSGPIVVSVIWVVPIDIVAVWLLSFKQVSLLSFRGKLKNVCFFTLLHCRSWICVNERHFLFLFFSWQGGILTKNENLGRPIQLTKVREVYTTG